MGLIIKLGSKYMHPKNETTSKKACSTAICWPKHECACIESHWFISITRSSSLSQQDCQLPGLTMGLVLLLRPWPLLAPRADLCSLKPNQNCKIPNNTGHHSRPRPLSTGVRQDLTGHITLWE